MDCLSLGISIETDSVVKNMLAQQKHFEPILGGNAVIRKEWPSQNNTCFQWIGIREHFNHWRWKVQGCTLSKKSASHLKTNESQTTFYHIVINIQCIPGLLLCKTNESLEEIVLAFRDSGCAGKMITEVYSEYSLTRNHVCGVQYFLITELS